MLKFYDIYNNLKKHTPPSALHNKVYIYMELAQSFPAEKVISSNCQTLLHLLIFISKRGFRIYWQNEKGYRQKASTDREYYCQVPWFFLAKLIVVCILVEKNYLENLCLISYFCSNFISFFAVQLSRIYIPGNVFEGGASLYPLLNVSICNALVFAWKWLSSSVNHKMPTQSSLAWNF